MTARAGGSKALLPRFKDYWPKIRVRMIRQVGPLKIWEVHGRVIRDHVFIDFTEGGNSEAYAWLPDDMIVIDADATEAEKRFTLLHEFTELNAMAIDGLGYEKAHSDHANVQEAKARRDPSKTTKLIQEQVDKYRAFLAKKNEGHDRVG